MENERAFCTFDELEESIKSCQNNTLPFGESHWDYLPDLIQNYIMDLAARAVHCDRMQAVCKSIHLHAEWCYQHQTFLEMLFDYYTESYRLNPSTITSQVCPVCYKIFSPEILLSKHFSVCRGIEYLEQQEMDYFSRRFETVDDEDEYIDDVYYEDEYYH